MKARALPALPALRALAGTALTPLTALAAMLCVGLAGGAAHAAHGTSISAAAPALKADREPPALLSWVLATQDNEGAPFIVIDKRRAQLWLYDAQGRALGNAPVLLGKARGDVSVPGIGERPMAQIRAHERTTPAGRFIAEPGRNAAGEDIYWIDYDAAVSMHRVRATHPGERRLQRLASVTPADNRISYGCINVPAAFYDGHIRPAFGSRGGVAYVMPETMGLHSLFTPVPTRVARP